MIPNLVLAFNRLVGYGMKRLHARLHLQALVQ